MANGHVARIRHMSATLAICGGEQCDRNLRGSNRFVEKLASLAFEGRCHSNGDDTQKLCDRASRMRARLVASFPGQRLRPTSWDFRAATLSRIAVVGVALPLLEQRQRLARAGSASPHVSSLV